MTVRLILSLACMMRFDASYVRSTKRPPGDVIRVRFLFASRVRVRALPYRSRIPITAACRGCDAKNESGKVYTAPFLNLRSHPFPFQLICDLKKTEGLEVCS